jgi:hypothetical protein
MDDRQRLLQRARDGALGPAENAALRAMLAADPTLAAAEERLATLDSLLRQEAAPRRQRSTDAVMAHIIDHLPARVPTAEMQLRLGDVIMGGLLVSLVAVTYSIIGTMFNHSAMLVALAVVSLVAGCGLLAFAGALRGDLPLLGALLRRRVAVGSGEVLVYRAVGCAIAVGGVWLSWLS